MHDNLPVLLTDYDVEDIHCFVLRWVVVLEVLGKEATGEHNVSGLIRVLILGIESHLSELRD